LVAFAKERFDSLRGKVAVAGGSVNDERARGTHGARHRALKALIKEPANDVLDFSTMW
jgi:hypothetical protein